MIGFVRSESEFLFYQAEDDRRRVKVGFDGDTAWLFSVEQTAQDIKRHSGDTA